MGQIHKMGDEYYVEFTARGLIYQQKAGADYAQAKLLLDSLERQIAQGEFMAQVRDIELDVFFTDFIKLSCQRYHPKTVKRIQSTIQHFTHYLQSAYPAVTRLSLITPKVMEDYKAYGIAKAHVRPKGINPNRVNLTILILRSVFDHGIKLGYIHENPTLHISLLNVRFNEYNSAKLSEVEFARVLTQVSASSKDVLLVMRYAGLRLYEAVDLKWNQVDLNRQMLFVRLREIPMNTQVAEVLNRLSRTVVDFKAYVFQNSDGRGIDPQELVRQFTHACRSTGCGQISLSVLRKAFILDLFRHRISFLQAAKLAGIHDAARLMFFSSVIPQKREDIQT